RRISAGRRGRPLMHPCFPRAWLPLLAAAALAVAVPARAADEAPLLPLNVFFANAAASADYRVSPDGTRVAWGATKGGRVPFPFRRIDETAARTVETPREARPPWFGGETFGWSRDGKRLLFLMDANGDENTHLFAVDVDAPEPSARDLTPLTGVRVDFVRVF